RTRVDARAVGSVHEPMPFRSVAECRTKRLTRRTEALGRCRTGRTRPNPTYRVSGDPLAPVARERFPLIRDEDRLVRAERDPDVTGHAVVSGFVRPPPGNSDRVMLDLLAVTEEGTHVHAHVLSLALGQTGMGAFADNALRGDAARHQGARIGRPERRHHRS